jgi:archaellum biogenesis ATPase FlaH
LPSNGANGHGVAVEFDGQIITPSQRLIRRFEDVPSIITMQIPPVDFIVPALGIARNNIVLWTGSDGDGKTFLAQRMAVAAARGDIFLGMRCQQSPVLVLDLENPGYTVQERLQAMVGEQDIPNLRVWGTWCETQPPQAGSELLLTICKETKPLLIVDPLRYFHTAEENSSDEMSGVMQFLRACAAYGAAVVLLHHPAKQEGSTGRGSSAIRGACDLAFLHSFDPESGLITLKVDKNRNGERRTITLRADFEQGIFETADAPYVTRRNDELAKLEAIIQQNPGVTQNSIVKQSGMMKARVGKLLKEGRGTSWVTREGSNRSILYYPQGWFSTILEPHGTTEPQGEQWASGSGGSPLKGGEPPNHRPHEHCSGGSDLVCPGCGLQGDWTTHLGLAKHMSVCKPGVH